MTATRLAGLCVLAVVLVLAAAWMGRDVAPGTHPERLLPELQGDPQAVGHVRLRDPAGRSVTLGRDGADWRLEERDGWLVDPHRLDTLLRALAGARLVEARTARREHFARLGVADLDQADATGTHLQLDTPEGPVGLVVGHLGPHGTGSFVRRDDDERSWLVDAVIDAPVEPVLWLDRGLVDLDASEILSLEIAHPEGAVVLGGDGYPPAIVTGVAEGAGIVREDHEAVRQALGFFRHLRLDDVARDADGGGEPLEPVELLMVAVDGLRIDAESWRAGPTRWIRMRVDFDREQAQRWAQRELALDEQALAASSTAHEGDDGARSVAERPAIEPSLRRDIDARVADAHARAEALALRVHGWAFQLTSPSQAVLETSPAAYPTPTG